MDKAKNAVSDFINKDGKHTTNVHETMGSAINHDTHHTHHDHKTHAAIDREVHQDHYKTTIQPVHGGAEQLPTQHHHQHAQVEHRKFEHGNDAEVQRRLDDEAAKHTHTQHKGETTHTTSEAPVVTGEHVHHHVHQKIVPEIHREQHHNHVVHTIAPIHEQHHNAAIHHSTNTLPAVSLQDFKKQGGTLTGRGERSDFFEGEPNHMTGIHAPNRPEDEANQFRKTGHTDLHDRGLSGTNSGSGLAGNSSTGTSGVTGGSHHHQGTTGNGLSGSGTTGSGLAGSNTAGSGLTGSNTTGTGSGLTGTNSSRTGGVTGGDLSHDRNDSTGVAQDTISTSKPSLLSRLNPLKDSDGDGKKGIMD